MIKKLLYIFITIVFTSCVNKFGFDEDEFQERLVVEGYIEKGEYPIVMLTTNKPLGTESSVETVKDMIIRWAKVVVSDGETEDILIGRIDENYFPPFIYKGTKIKGEAGKTYQLKVIYAQYELTAQTTIPPSVPIDNIYCNDAPENDSLYQIHIDFNDPAEQKNYYKIYTQVLHKNKKFVPALGGNLNDNLFNGQQVSIKINQGIEQLPAENIHTDFYKEDTVRVKLCTVPKEGFEFWKGYENEIVNGQNPLTPANKNLKSNIQGGGIGIWCGYGKSIYYIRYK